MTLEEYQNSLLTKINLKVKNSGNKKIDHRFLNLSKIQRLIYVLLNWKIIYITTKYFIRISKYLDNVLLIKAAKLTLLDPNNSPTKKSFNLLENIKNDKMYGYNELTEITRFFQNKKLIKQKNNNGDLFTRVNFCVNETEKILSSDHKVKKLFTVGCSYAYYESVIAKKFEHIQVKCFDRSEITALLNKREFVFSNINFHYGDMIDFLIKQEPVCSIFNHMWTLAYLPKDYVEHIYSNLKKNKTKYIILTERFGISRETGEFFEFSFEDIPSVRYYNDIFIHNYPGILRKYNFDIAKLQVKEIQNKKYSYLLYIVAKNNLL